MCGGCGWGRLVPSMCFATIVVPVCVVLCHSDEAENRIHKKLGIKFKKGLNSNLIPTCLVFIDLKKGLNSNLIPTCLLFI